MRSLFSTVFVFTLFFVGCTPTNKGPLSFQLPAGWKAKHQTPGGLHFYTVTAGTPGGGLLMFSQWPSPSRPEEIPGLVQKLADGFLDQVKKSPEFTLVTHEYRVEQFTGSQCQGSYATFETSSSGTNVLQAMFLLSVDGKVWNGQFTGSSNTWFRAIGVLKSIKNDT